MEITPSEFRLFPPGTILANNNIDDVLGNDESLEDEDEGCTGFALEYQLRDFIAQNLNVIRVENRRLRLYTDENGRNGVEYPTDAGPIDILAIDDQDNFVVFELKRARSPDHAIGQLTRYMGRLVQTVAKGKQVRGVIVAKSITANLRYSIAVVPNVSLFEYDIKFELKPVPSHD